MVLTLIWLIDIFNIGKDINGFNLAEFLDVTLPINTLMWLLVILLTPKSEINIDFY